MFTQGAPRGRGRGGLGIGLTLVRILVGMHGGSVEANSPGAGGGSTFRVRLPLVPGQAEGRTAHAAATPLTSRCRVLLVDDNPDVADTLGRLLRMLGAEVEVVYDGPSALQALERFHPTAMILDIGMPGMDGYEVARRIRQHPQGRDITLIALTGWGQTEDRLRSRRTGFDHHLVKPADLEELQRLLGAERQ
jgi:CheY-like chemotaxis protein